MRAAHRAAAVAARNMGLSFLQMQQVTEDSRSNLTREVDAFGEWCLVRGFSAPKTAAELDELIPSYLDEIFFDGYNHDRGEKLVSGLRFMLPTAGLNDRHALSGTLAALKGFRRLAHGATRSPMARQLLLCGVGSALRRG